MVLAAFWPLLLALLLFLVPATPSPRPPFVSVLAAATASAAGGGGGAGDGAPRSNSTIAARGTGGGGALEREDSFGQNLGLGKDRELFHASIDLRQAWAKLTDRGSWVALFQRVLKTLSHVSGSDDNHVVFKEIAIEMVCGIRKLNPDAHIKLFQGTIKQAEQYARRTGRFIVVYVEDGSPSLNHESRAAQTSESFRKAFSDNHLADILNEKFVFYAGSTAHAPTSNMAKLLGYAKKDLPLFAVLTPSWVDAPSMDKKRLLPEVIVTLRLSAFDVDSSKVQRFVQRVLEIHGPVLASKKRDFDDLVNAEIQMSNIAIQEERSKADARRRSLLLRKLPPEPNRQIAEAIKISIVLKSGKLERRFLPSESALSVFNWADAHAACSPNDSELVLAKSSTFGGGGAGGGGGGGGGIGKGVTLRHGELSNKPTLSLQDLGIVKDATLTVQNLVR